MSQTYVYDADQIVILIGTIPVTTIGGYAEGEFLTIKQESADFTDKVGTDGTVTRSKTLDRRATAEIKTMQSSPLNTALTALNNLDVAQSGGAGIVGFQVMDLQGNTVFTASACWIVKAPDVSFHREVTERTWTLRLAHLVRFDGGSKFKF